MALRSRRRQWWGIVLILVGCFMLLDSFRVIDFSDAVHTYWPALLVLWGVYIIMRHRPGPSADAGSQPTQTEAVFEDTRTTSSSESIHHSNVFGDVSVDVTSTGFKGGSVSTVFGDTTINIAGGGIAEGEHRLKISGVFGDMRVILPKGSAVFVKASGLLGNTQVYDQRKEGFGGALQYETSGFAVAPRRLRIDISQVFGDCEVREY
jgi:predicted membrane protein